MHEIMEDFKKHKTEITIFAIIVAVIALVSTISKNMKDKIPFFWQGFGQSVVAIIVALLIAVIIAAVFYLLVRLYKKYEHHSKSSMRESEMYSPLPGKWSPSSPESYSLPSTPSYTPASELQSPVKFTVEK